MKYLRNVATGLLWLLAALMCTPAGAQEPKKVTILYDAFGPPSALTRDWGFAAFVEYGGRRILFDTGNDGRIFAANVCNLGIDLTRLDAVVISHRHGDHTSGLSHLIEQNPGVRIDAPLVETRDARDERGVAGLPNTGRAGGHRRRLASGRREDPRESGEDRPAAVQRDRWLPPRDDAAGGGAAHGRRAARCSQGPGRRARALHERARLRDLHRALQGSLRCNGGGAGAAEASGGAAPPRCASRLAATQNRPGAEAGLRSARREGRHR